MGCTYYIGGQEFTEKEFKKHLAGELDNYVKKGLVDLTKIKTIKNEKNKGSNVREIQKNGQGNAQNEGGQQNGKNVGQETNVQEEKVVQGEATPQPTALKDVESTAKVGSGVVGNVKTGLLDYFRNIKKDSAFDVLISIGDKMGIGIEEYESDSPLAANFNGTNVTINKRFGRASTNNIAHEVIHGILHKLTSNEYKGSSLDVKLQKFKQELFDYIDSKGIDNLNLKPELKILYLDYIRKNENSQEIVTFAFTNEQFHNFLSSIKSEGVANKSKTFWGKLKDIFKSTLQENGIRSKLDDLVDLLDSEVPLKAVEDLPSKEQPTAQAEQEKVSTPLQIAAELLEKLGIKKAKDVLFSKKNKRTEGLTPQLDKEKEIIDEMNSMELVNNGVDLNPSFTTNEKIDLEELNKRLDTPLASVVWDQFKGMPFGFTISDQLRTGNKTISSIKKIIKNLKGGIGFNGTKENENNAWANTGDAEANAMYAKALEIYENNKPLFEKLWAEGKLPDGHVPFGVVKMGEDSIISNEAVRRLGIENIKTLPIENRENAVIAFKSELERKIKKESSDLERGTKQEKVKNKLTGVNEIKDTKIPYSKLTIQQKEKYINQYKKILDLVNNNNYTDIVDVLKNAEELSLPEKAIVFNEIFYGAPNKIGKKSAVPGKPTTLVSETLLKGLDNSKRALINIGVITDLLTEPSMKNVPSMHIVSVVGVKVAKKENNKWVKAGGPTSVNHLNYKYGVEGKSIGILTQPIHMKDAFGEAYASVISQIIKNEAANASITIDKALSQGIPVQSGLPNRVLKSAIAQGRLDAVDKLSGFLRQAFPNTTYFTSQEAWDSAMADPSIKKKLKDGDVVYAFTTDGNVFINPNLKTTKATLHETGHIWMGFVKEKNPALYKKGLSLVDGTKEYKAAKSEYGNTELAREEALMELMSSKGDTIVNAAQKAKFKEWLLTIYKYVSDNFTSLLGLSEKQIENLTIDKFLEGMLSDILSGEELTSKKTKETVKFSKQSQDAKIKEFINEQRDKGVSEEDIKAGIEKASEDIEIGDIDALMGKPSVEGGKVEAAQTKPSEKKKVFQTTKTKFNKISSKAFDKLVTRLNKAFPKTKVNVLSSKEMDDKLQEIGGNAGVNFQMVVNGENVTVQPINAEVVNGFYSPLEKIINETKLSEQNTSLRAELNKKQKELELLFKSKQGNSEKAVNLKNQVAKLKEQIQSSETKTDNFSLSVNDWKSKFGESEEAKWTGLTDWLNQQQGSVSKADIQQYLKDNRIEVVEVVKTDKTTKEQYNEDAIKKGNKVGLEVEFGSENEIQISLPGEGYLRPDEVDTKGHREFTSENYNVDISVLEIANELFNENKSKRYRSSNEGQVFNTKYSQYQLEGEKENYKEVLVTMPSSVNEKRLQELIQKKRDRTITEAEEKEFDAFDKKVAKEFQSSHFEEPNILVHLRMNTRTDADGNKVLFLEEVQSDWGQKGKKEGFYDNAKVAELDSKIFKLKEQEEAARLKKADALAKIKETNPNTSIYTEINNGNKEIEKLWSAEDAIFKERLEVQKERDALMGKKMIGGDTNVPTAPFVTDTNAWTKLGLKVALKEAVKQGADKIAWTTGEQQNDRYNLKKDLNYLDYWKNDNGTYGVTLNFKKPQEFTKPSELTEKELTDYFGKEIATKIVLDTSSPTENNPKRLEGDDLAVGGKGMEEFYGVPADMKRVKDFTIKKEGELFAVKDEKGKTIRTFKQENEANKFKENYGLGIVGSVAKSLTKQEPKKVTLDIGENENYKYIKDKRENNKVVVDYKGNKKFFDDFSSAQKWVDENIGSGTTQHSIEITPELKAGVEGGQPLFMKNKNGEVYGFEYNGEIYIDRTKLNANTPIHEFGHVWLNFIKQSVQFKEHYEKGVALIKNTKEGKAYLDAVKANEAYKDLSESEQIDEALAMAIGDKGEMLHGNKYNKLKNWIKELWDGIKRKFNVIENVDAFQGMTLEDFTKNAVGSLMKGEEIIDTQAQQQEQTPPEKAPLSEELQKLKDGFVKFIKNKTKGLGDAEVQKAIDNLFSKYDTNKDFIQELKDNNLSLEQFKNEVESELITKPNINEQQNATNNTEGQVQEVNQPSGSQKYQGTQNVSEAQTTEANRGNSGGGSKEKEVTPINEQIANIGNTAEQVSSDAVTHRKDTGFQIVTGEDKMKTDIALNAKDAEVVLMDLKDTYGKNYLTKAIEAYMDYASTIGAGKKQLSSLASFGIVIENEIKKLQDGTIENTYNLNHRDLEMALRKIQPLNAELAQSVSASLNVQKTLYSIFDESEAAKELMTTKEEEESKNIKSVLENKDGQLDAAAEEHEQAPQEEQKPPAKPAKDTRKPKKISAKDKAESKQKKSEILKELKEQIKKLNC